MPANGISRLYSYSLTDLHDFDDCPFRLYVNHHLNKKYEIETGNRKMALGSLLDETLKRYHMCKAYDLDASKIINLIRGAANYMRNKEAESIKKPSFYTGIVPFLDEELIAEVNQIFLNFLKETKIKKSISKVEFCSKVLKGEECLGTHDDETKCCFVVWGLPDAYEMGEDDVLEVVDYKSRTDIERGKENMDMELMPKMYALLCCDYLLKMGFEKIRFCVRFWQDPADVSFCEEFDLKRVCEYEALFREKIQRVIDNRRLSFCEKPFCKACKSEKRAEFIKELIRFNVLEDVSEGVLLDSLYTDKPIVGEV